MRAPPPPPGWYTGPGGRSRDPLVWEDLLGLVQHYKKQAP
jgi:hypothetical protein